MVEPIECPKCRLFTAFRRKESSETAYECKECGLAFKAFIVSTQKAS